MSAPLARGLIIAASVVVAAGIAIMENDQIRKWLDEHRRRIAIALHSLGDGINPSHSENESHERQAEMEHLNRERRHEIVRRNREELLRRAREEGTSVDLDELTALGMLEKEAEEDMRRARQQPIEMRSESNTDFGHFVGNDGKLRLDLQSSPALATALPEPTVSGLRQRTAGSRGFASGSSFAMNPFGDEMAIDEHDATELTPEAVERNVTVRQSNTPSTVHNIPIIQTLSSSDIHPQQYKSEDELNAEIAEAIRQSLKAVPDQLVNVTSPANSSETAQLHSEASTPHSLADSLFGPPSPRAGHASVVRSAQSGPQDLTAPIAPFSPTASFYSADEGVTTIDAYFYDGDRTPMGSGTLTPTDDAFSTISSAAGDLEGDLINLADVRSEAGTNDSFSVVGTSTPGTWSEVGSDDGSELDAGVVSQHQPQS